jgi:predicted TIM-barrel enzyme
VADGLIVGSALKRGGAVTAPVDVDRVRSLVSSAGRV